MKPLFVLCITLTLCLLALHTLAPGLTSELIEHFDFSDVISSLVMGVMAVIILWQESKLRQSK